MGETMNFRNRMNTHKSNIRLRKTDEEDCAILYEHFKLAQHSVDTLQFTILQQCTDKGSLRNAETRWMWQLKTHTPHGLNIKNGLDCHHR